MRSSSPLLSLSCLLATLLFVNVQAHPSPKVKGYYPTYNAKAQPPSKIDWSAYTDVLFFMVIPQADFSLAYDPKLTPAEGQKLVTEFVAEARKNHVNPLFSTGGWTGSQHFSNLTLTEAGRKKFAKSLVDFGKKNGFTGIELDWEYANGQGIGCNSRNPADVVNFGLFVKEIRALWPQADLTAAVGITGLIGADGGAATTTETALLTQNLNYINLMAYDVYGAWAPTTGPLAPLHATCAPAAFGQSVETGLQVALKQGFKPSQVVLGIPGYAKRLELTSPTLGPTTVSGQSSFYYQNHTTVTPPGGNFDDKPGKDICGNARAWGGSFLVNELISNGWLSKDQKTGLNGYKRHWDACSGQPFLTNGKYLITYDDLDSTIAKAKFAKQNQLGGIYFFDTMGPTPATVRAARQAVY
ncbi:hypothetical protein MJO29_015134 [Puccinia striiformis f. sp. tritici]|uniref:GH18 domain-containing protein n=1 Tax=Puccinia striiformis f. sp. tritici PST-78 TaxID=1165861 RepID=A0A0L0VTY5_9BASI|nr:hypothetical protein Pst134EA_028187 [Puccinia striiformis f. sp. tritici]KAI9627952.1 hypothetical protein KEM48_011889 [Puccinia striiformis f. sp. tritici PST-130]KNF02731.1 hypothetical protein PSTG_04016 [Puccinia striiformis f. sp. tritici PST-78]KAH9442481.1 hypothetical protein Pst134EB_028732 [Puccinia striiformis f. sp. tritici]KAH9448895.1 hypothetical protein Pst134EA_028187 [Puccinia striiformis f. sp. tritici]KAI7937819.1 hypothetical protein MJO29_015134 [Puccinia striiformis